MHDGHQRTDKIHTDYALIAIGAAVAVFTLLLPWTTQLVYGVTPVRPPEPSRLAFLYLITFGWARILPVLHVLMLSIAGGLSLDLTGLPQDRKREILEFHGTVNSIAYATAFLTVLVDVVATVLFTDALARS